MLNLDINLATILATVLTVIGATWTLAWRFSRQFEEVKGAILSKLEYHERHDDERFSGLNDSLWEIRLQTAIKNGHVVVKDYKAQKAKSRA